MVSETVIAMTLQMMMKMKMGNWETEFNVVHLKCMPNNIKVTMIPGYPTPLVKEVSAGCK